MDEKRFLRLFRNFVTFASLSFVFLCAVVLAYAIPEKFGTLPRDLFLSLLLIYLVFEVALPRIQQKFVERKVTKK